MRRNLRSQSQLHANIESMSTQATPITMESLNAKLDKLLDQVGHITTLQSDIAALNTTVKSLESELKTASNDITDIKTSVEFGNTTANEAKETAKSSKAECVTMQNNIDKLELENARLRKEHNKLFTRVVSLESYGRRDNLLVFGIQEAPGENVLDKIQNLFTKDLKIDNALDIRIVRSHRLGPPKKGFHRPIIIRFHYFGDRQLVWGKRSKLKGQSVWLAEDFPQEVMEARKQMLPFLKAAWSAGKKATMLVDKLLIDGKTYTKDTLHNIPSDIDPSASCERITENLYLFFGRYSPLSNFHDAPFTCDGHNYYCVEHYLQHQKALLMGDHVTAKQIYEEHNPAKQKSLGRHVAKFNAQVWSENSTDIMRKGCEMKFDANPNLRDYLKQTGTRVIAEASADVYWGTGKLLRDPSAVNQDQWNGRNELGKVLMAIRQEL